MKKEMIRIKGVRENNLKNIDLEVPRNQFIVFTGLSGSGKSSLAFDTIYAEGREDIWNHYLPMQDSFWDRWRNRM